MIINNNARINNQLILFVKKNKESHLLKNLNGNSRYYFVHSFYVQCEQKEDILLCTNYGFEFTSAVENDNIYGTQFHPEKSHKYGMQLLRNFIEQC